MLADAGWRLKPATDRGGGWPQGTVQVTFSERSCQADGRSRLLSPSSELQRSVSPVWRWSRGPGGFLAGEASAASAGAVARSGGGGVTFTPRLSASGRLSPLRPAPALPISG